MPTIAILTERDLRSVVRLDGAVVDLVESAFRQLASGEVVMPPVLSMELHDANGEVDVKTAHVEGLDSFAIKVSPGFFDNPEIGLPSTNGLMVVLSARTGLVEALLLDNGYLTDLRTAAAGAAAARALAPADVETVGIVGTGLQARLQAQAALLARPRASQVLVWGRDAGKAGACAAAIAAAAGVSARAEADLPRLMAASQLVVTTTPSRAPLVTASHLHPGLHITAMGSDQAGKNEIEPAALAAADLYVADRLSQCAAIGELRAARAAGLMQADPPELGAVLAGTAEGRGSQADVTVCDLTGTGAQDTVIAARALALARRAGLGSMIEA